MITNKHHDYGIWLSYDNQKSGFQLPVNPAELQISDATGGKTYDVSGLGEINVIQSPKLTEISFDSFFPAPGANYSFIASKTLLEPYVYLTLIQDWMKKKRPIRFIFTGASFDLNLAVSIEKFEWREAAGSGDIEYSLGLKKYVFYKARPVKINKKHEKSGGKERDTKGRQTKETPKTYTLVSGDTLIGVARKQLGDESRWKEIQKLNGIADSELRKLQIGRVLKLPG
ncbi:Nucleoid-associated protein YgaU, contains BON and LysM domains [Paenibacillus algorifonticola]|uniref:Nucleoid-associated protein YgaU, contains BON and LysM domains n=1 Tax=Paenibacillus algorifonticola TaxID=684063 RepID=A0A1I2ETH3_9BACL|nr:LysM peptidoglycan-binding domain-containing protein [Paenibacillus algorifonticola]SFE96125.1 Nucleoid-associated protein YgaU, contains BON and LysM domains [Paenibacillus algorifonticola]